MCFNNINVTLFIGNPLKIISMIHFYDEPKIQTNITDELLLKSLKKLK